MNLAMGAKPVQKPDPTRPGPPPKEVEQDLVAPDLVPYDLRHTFCTDLQKAGVPLNVAKDLMGHADITTTANIYTHRDSATLHAGISLLDGSSRDSKAAASR
jgi:integrase